MGAVRLNQMGYSLNCTKRVVFVGEANTFYLCNVKDDRIEYIGTFNEGGLDEASGEILCTGDFSSYQKPGEYYIKVKEEKSFVFTISKEQTRKCMDALLKGFYFQRCGVEITKEYAGRWKHPACHLQPSYLFCQDAENKLLNNPKELERIDTAGGWHDAGDYGRYTIATVKTVADLLLAYKHFGAAFDHPINIPESSRKGADILHEVKVGLDFLLKMQREDGAVYTKVATRYFPGMIMPETDTMPLFVFDISSPATAGFTAVMAMASQIYEEFDEKYGETCLKAAEKSYQWLKQNPEPVLFYNPPNIISCEYGDDSDIDERYWAAAQMYSTTGNEEYHQDFLLYYFLLNDRKSLGWRSVGGYGTIAYLFSDFPIVEEVYDKLKSEWLSYAIKLIERSHQDGYGITLARNDYTWGSLMKLQNQSIHLIIAERLLNKSEYRDTIRNNWDYMFGMNPMNISYVTGMGKRTVMHPHHRPSAADEVEEPVPGLVAGGPCAGLVDDVAKQHCKGQPPAKCFVDHEESFSTNEIDIYWNSPAVYVGAYLCLK